MQKQAEAAAATADETWRAEEREKKRKYLAIKCESQEPAAADLATAPELLDSSPTQAGMFSHLRCNCPAAHTEPCRHSTALNHHFLTIFWNVGMDTGAGSGLAKRGPKPKKVRAASHWQHQKTHQT